MTGTQGHRDKRTVSQGHRDTPTRASISEACQRPAPWWRPIAPPLDPPALQLSPLALDDPVLQVLPPHHKLHQVLLQVVIKIPSGDLENSEYRKVICCLLLLLLTA